MPFVVFTTPWFSPLAIHYIQALHDLPDVRVGVITQDPVENLAPDVRFKVAAHWRVDNIADVGQVVYAAESLARWQGQIHRLFTPHENIQVQIAEVRERLGIPGMSVEATRNFREKARMKALFRQNGLPCARYQLVTSDAEAWRFVDDVGFPIVVKPPAGAGTQATFRINSAEALRDALPNVAPQPERPVLFEEFITGDEHTFDTFSAGGKPLFHSIIQYYPTPLDVLRNPWIQWRVVLPREVDDPKYDDIRQAGRRALEVLGMGTGVSHMEWFRRRDGSIAISEVAARPPGAQFTTIMSRANDFDCIAAAARLMVFDQFDPPERRYAVGAAYLRGLGQGRVKTIHGLEQAQQEIGHLVTDARLPAIGQEHSMHYEGDGYIIVRHPETEVVKQALERIINLVRIELV